MTIRITDEINLEDFDAWSGGRTNLDSLEEYDLISEAERYINDVVSEPLNSGELNDILWFDKTIQFMIDEAYELEQSDEESEDE